MIGKLAMKLYETFEAAYSDRLSRLARSRLFLELAGRRNDLMGLVKRLSDRQAEQALELLRLPTPRQLTDALRSQRKLEMENRRLRRQLDELADRLDRLEKRRYRGLKGS